MAISDSPVTINKKEVVAAALPLQEHWLPLSNLDLLLPPLDVGIFFCYGRINMQNHLPFSSMVEILKASLTQVLVTYYAFAGEIVLNLDGEPELLCNNSGVDFVESYTAMELRELDLYNPDASVEGKLVPKKKRGVLAVQATELGCGGIVVGCTFDHRIADAHSANMFLVSWAKAAQSKSPTVFPSFRRSLLSPRRPGSYEPSIDDLYVLISSLPPPESPKPGADTTISRIYYMTAADVDRLQALASGEGGSRRTKFESVSAFLWRIVASSCSDGSKRCKMGVVMDGRIRLSRDGDMSSYFGNVLSIPYGEEKVGELVGRPLSWAAEAVHNFLAGAATEEHFRGLIDWVEARRPEPAMTKLYRKGAEDGPVFVMSGGMWFPVTEVDFGWGQPAFGSYHFPWGGDAGYVMPMPSARGNGDWVVYMHLLKGQLDTVEAKAGHIFKPLTADYLKLDGDF